MIEQGQGRSSGKAEDARRRQVGGVAFLVGLVGALAFFAFFPGLPHVIDWGAVLVSLAVGAVARWGCLTWAARRARKKAGEA
ncbi:hypothetical protein AB0O67_20360 [Streptomyces sp. NPDC086077]|uniref:hypothetical protein n=1 Tax=Streptomyces sp. NPDC086077 TaxID=3154862 RepID=UPI003422871A